MNEFFQTLGIVAAAASLFATALQLRQGNKQSKTDFEDSLAREYRELARRLPSNALLNIELSESEHEKAFPDFCQYVDLSNEQVFLRTIDRISAETWTYWRDGIRTNLSRPAFRTAWVKIKLHSPNSFQELRRLEDSDFKEDPKKWKETAQYRSKGEVN